MELLHQHGLDDVLVIVGGIIPDVDVPRLKDLGIAAIFLPGTPMQADRGLHRRHMPARVNSRSEAGTARRRCSCTRLDPQSVSR